MSRSRGFTMVELMIALAIGAILMSLGAPAVIDTVRDNRAATQVNELVGAMSYARGEAVTRGVTVSIRPLNTTPSGTSYLWESGWSVFTDLNSNGVADVGTGACLATEDCVLRREPALAAGNTLRSVRGRVTFSARSSAAGYNGTWTLCDSRGAAHASGVILFPTGRARAARDDNDDGLREDADGNPLACP